VARSDKTETVPRSRATKSLAKCVEFADVAASSLTTERWNAAGLNAIHSGISAADATLIASAGLRSASADHGAVIMLLESQVPEFSTTQRRQLLGLLQMKNRVAYEQRLLTETEARQLVDHASRLSKWAERVVKKHLAE
jgi:hypothetical protein